MPGARDLEDRDKTLMVALPILIAVTNLISAYWIRRGIIMGRLAVFGWIIMLFLTTGFLWFLAGMPFAMGLADSAASCTPSDPSLVVPGCERYVEVSLLFDRTFGA